MTKCSLKIVNAAYDNNFYKVKYIPCSISTIKLLIQNFEECDVDILIKPTRYQNDDDFCGGFDDDKKGLKIIWGGGEENGVTTRVKGKDGKYAYFFVFPMDNFRLLDYNLTLRINKTRVGFNGESTSEEMKIKLYPIQKVQLIDDIVHQKKEHNSQNTTITFEGNLLGNYYPRWYPEHYSLFNDSKNYYQLDNFISNISLKTFKKLEGQDRDRIILYFKQRKVGTIDGDMEGASYHIDVFKFNNAFIIRIWFLWISKKQFLEAKNLEPLEIEVTERAIFDNPELPDFERFDIVISASDGTILSICTDFHWQEFWYKLNGGNDVVMEGIIAKLLHPLDQSLSRLLNRHFVDNNYEDIINNLQKITSLSENFDSKPDLIYVRGKEIEDSVQKQEKDIVARGRNFFRSHVPYIRNADILSNMISSIVDKYE
ncbi:MAG TPA: hypothetical protein VK250_00075 [Nitrososphaeraceae archaeon]|nr:hypothetical protein [Nitrososphaeraceae archaeon]